jgi:hypothetical protein
MPTVLVAEGFRFYFFSNEREEPPHVHVRKGDGVAKVWLSPLRVGYSEGLTRADLRRVRELTFENGALFIERWHEYFGR